MTPFIVGLIGLLVLLILVMFSRMIIGISLALVGFIGFAILSGIDASLGMIQPIAYSTFSSYNLSVIPLFILMGAFAYHSALSRDLYETFYKWFGKMAGGLAIASVFACAFFSAVCGSSVAAAASMGAVATPEMKRYKYSAGLATGIVAAGGTLGTLIPPSTAFILFGILTSLSIGKLFLAGVLPGILKATLYTLTVSIVCKINPLTGPPGQSVSFKDRMVSLKSTWVVSLLFLIVIGGLYLGVFTATEAAGIGCFGAFILGLARKQLGRSGIKKALQESMHSTGMIFLILFGAMIFGYFLSISRVPNDLSMFIIGLKVNRYLILTLILLLLLLLGCVIEALAILVLTTPIIYPVIISLGFDGIWFGVIMVVMMELGLITPPVGMNVFVIAGMNKDVPIWTIFRGITPFIISDICLVLLLVIFPQISTFIPTSSG